MSIGMFVVGGILFVIGVVFVVIVLSNDFDDFVFVVEVLFLVGGVEDVNGLFVCGRW